MRATNSTLGAFAERLLRGATWAVGRTVDSRARSIPEPRDDDYIFEGYEMGDAIEAANNTLADELAVFYEESPDESPPRFTEEDLLKPLAWWFFDYERCQGRAQ